MIKKISLYGLCFNLGVAFAVLPTRQDIDQFIEDNKGNLEIRRGFLDAPDEILLKNQDAITAWENFSGWKYNKETNYWKKNDECGGIRIDRSIPEYRGSPEICRKSFERCRA